MEPLRRAVGNGGGAAVLPHDVLTMALARLPQKGRLLAGRVSTDFLAAAREAEQHTSWGVLIGLLEKNDIGGAVAHLNGLDPVLPTVRKAMQTLVRANAGLLVSRLVDVMGAEAAGPDVTQYATQHITEAVRFAIELRHHPLARSLFDRVRDRPDLTELNYIGLVKYMKQHMPPSFKNDIPAWPRRRMF